MKPYVTVGRTKGFRPTPRTIIEADAPFIVIISMRRYVVGGRADARATAHRRRADVCDAKRA
jgi:hypothetical protein